MSQGNHDAPIGPVGDSIRSVGPTNDALDPRRSSAPSSISSTSARSGGQARRTPRWRDVHAPVIHSVQPSELGAVD